MAAAAVPDGDASVLDPSVKCAVQYLELSNVMNKIGNIIDNLQVKNQLVIPNVLNLDVISIIVGSYVNAFDIDKRNHECPAFVRRLMTNPKDGISPNIFDLLKWNHIQNININQTLFLIDPMYSREEYSIPHGLMTVYPSIKHNPIITVNGDIYDDDISFKYNATLEPYIIPSYIEELLIDNIIEKFQKINNQTLLINIMDCTSHVLRRLWVQNTVPNVYLAMPNCLANDNMPMYMPVITYSLSLEQLEADDISHEQYSKSKNNIVMNGFRWINWNYDKEYLELYKFMSPNTYKFLIDNYKCMVLETYFISIIKILGRMSVSYESKLNDETGTVIVFSRMTFQEFKYLWKNKRSEFVPLFMGFMDSYYKWNYYKFIDILLDEHYYNEEPSMQTILLNYLYIHLQKLKDLFPEEHIPEFNNDYKQMQTTISHYLNHHNIHF